MVEAITDYLVGLFRNTIPKELIIFIISMLPIVELRGGMIAAKLLDINLAEAFTICYIGNLIPIPFILLFIRKIFGWLKKFNGPASLVNKLEEKSMAKKDKVMRYKNWGLLLFVAIPLPGTGGWTGALIAALLDIRMRKSLPIIALGVLIANLIMTLFSYGLLGVFI